MPTSTDNPLRIAAIHFLNPAPLMWDFEHAPHSAELADRYTLAYTQPSLCAEQLLSGEADVGLIPIAALTPDLVIVPGCTIASLSSVRSIVLLLKHPHTLATIRTVAADTASRSSVAYTEVILRRFHGNQPTVMPCLADPVEMLRHADAALLIGDPALLARQHLPEIQAITGPLLAIDLAHEWHTHTSLPWVAAVWAARPESLTSGSAQQLNRDLNLSRDHGLTHIDDLVREWSPRIAIPPSTIRTYLTQNIHYHLHPACLRAIELFRQLAADLAILPPLGDLRLLEPDLPLGSSYP